MLSLYWVHPVPLESKQSTGSSPPVLHSKLVHLPCLAHFLHLSVKTNKSAQSEYRKQSQETQLAPRYITKHKHKPQLCTLSDYQCRVFYALRPKPKHCVGWLENCASHRRIPSMNLWRQKLNRKLVGKLPQLVLWGVFSCFASRVLFVWDFVLFFFITQNMEFKAWKLLLLKQRKAIVLYN